MQWDFHFTGRSVPGGNLHCSGYCMTPLRFEK